MLRRPARSACPRRGPRRVAAGFSGVDICTLPCICSADHWGGHTPSVHVVIKHGFSAAGNSPAAGAFIALCIAEMESGKRTKANETPGEWGPR